MTGYFKFIFFPLVSNALGFIKYYFSKFSVFDYDGRQLSFLC
jgi:hypothetical protein